MIRREQREFEPELDESQPCWSVKNDETPLDVMALLEELTLIVSSLLPLICWHWTPCCKACIWLVVYCVVVYVGMLSYWGEPERAPHWLKILLVCFTGDLSPGSRPHHTKWSLTLDRDKFTLECHSFETSCNFEQLWAIRQICSQVLRDFKMFARSFWYALKSIKFR